MTVHLFTKYTPTPATVAPLQNAESQIKTVATVAAVAGAEVLNLSTPVELLLEKSENDFSTPDKGS